jgi:hypothetical protein
MNELVIERDVGEVVDAGLVDQEPVGDAERLAHLRFELLPRHCLRHFALRRRLRRRSWGRLWS